MHYAGAMFDTLRDAAAGAVERLRKLPAPPRGLWHDPDPGRLLARSKGHEGTLSVVAVATERFWEVQKVVPLVRQRAGYVPEKFGDASRHALTFRNWLGAMEGEPQWREVGKPVRLWWSTVEAGREPGVWRPEDAERGQDVVRDPVAHARLGQQRPGDHRVGPGVNGTLPDRGMPRVSRDRWV